MSEDQVTEELREKLQEFVQAGEVVIDENTRSARIVTEAFDVQANPDPDKAVGEFLPKAKRLAALHNLLATLEYRVEPPAKKGTQGSR